MNNVERKLFLEILRSTYKVMKHRRAPVIRQLRRHKAHGEDIHYEIAPNYAGSIRGIKKVDGSSELYITWNHNLKKRDDNGHERCQQELTSFLEQNQELLRKVI